MITIDKKLKIKIFNLIFIYQADFLNQLLPTV